MLAEYDNFRKRAAKERDGIYGDACADILKEVLTVKDSLDTGAVQHLGYPVFFRESCIHRLYGSTPATFRLQTTPCPGVQQGCSGSLALVGQVLYYKSPAGVCAYDGAMPVTVSQKLGQQRVTGAEAGA